LVENSTLHQPLLQRANTLPPLASEETHDMAIPEATRARVTVLWAQRNPQLSKPQIAAAMGVTPGVVSGWISRMKLPLRPNNGCAARFGSPAVVRTDEERAAAKREKYRRSNELRTRKRVAKAEEAGRMLRTRRRMPEAGSTAPAPAEAALADQTPRERPASVTAAPASAGPSEPAAAAPVPTVHGCAWPTWAAKDAAYYAAIHAGHYLQCSEPVTMRTLPDGSRERSTLCAEHLAICYVPTRHRDVHT
jgi:hypothetical protein